ncbi:MAG: YdcF family protein [Alphaproteobacteria bacterium]
MRRFLLVIFVCWLIGIVRYICLIPILPSEVKADAIVVFTGGANRVRTGGLLLQQNRGEYLLVSGVYPRVQQREIFDSLSLDPERITLDYQAHNTLNNVLKTKEWIERNGFHSIYLVTAHYHLPRAILLLKRELPSVDIIAYPVITREFKQPYWWFQPDTMLKFLREYHKFLLAQLRFYS